VRLQQLAAARATAPQLITERNGRKPYVIGVRARGIEKEKGSDKLIAAISRVAGPRASSE